jgi:hypothetical protein
MNQNARKPLRLRPVAEYLLYQIYSETMNNDQKSRFDHSDIERIVSRDIPRNLLMSAIDLLREYEHGSGRFIARHGNKEKYEYSITRDGIIRVEQEIQRGDSIAAFLLKQPDAEIQDVAGFDGLFYYPGEQKKLDNWSPLDIDREGDDYQTTVEVLEESLEAIRGDNGFAEEYPEQRAGILDALREGLDWLKNKAPSSNVLKKLLVDPLRWIAVTFGKSMLGNAGKIAAERVMKLIFSSM